MPRKIEDRGNGSYLLTVANGYDKIGKQILLRKTISATSQRDAQRQYIEFAAAVRNGAIADTKKLRLSEFAEVWLEKYCRPQLAPKTFDSYEYHLKKRIIPILGHIVIKKLKPVEIISFVDNLTQNPERYDGKTTTLSEQTILYCYRVLSSMLQTAVHWQILVNNPCTRVKPPKSPKSKNASFTIEQTQELLSYLPNAEIKYQAVIILALATGLRLGELMGLQWPDIDF